MGLKIEAIRRALFHKGIPITEGIPEEIIKELRVSGYKIKKIKKYSKKNSTKGDA